MKNVQLDSLTSTRFFAAILVVIHHFGRGVFPFDQAPHFFKNGNLCVSYFFVLSGFILTLFDKGARSYSDFIKRRAARILPMYYFALVLVLFLVFLGQVMNEGRVLPDNFWKQVVYSTFLIQSFIPNYPLTLNLPAWSLSIEAFFYLLFPLMLMFSKKHFRVFMLCMAVLFITSQCLHNYYYPIRSTLSDEWVDFIFFNPVMHLSQFMIGMLGAYFYRKYQKVLKNKRYLPLLSFTIIFIIMAIRPDYVSFHTGLLAPLFMLAIVFTAATDPKTLRWKPLVVLGNASYGIYILQHPLYQAAELSNAYFHLEGATFFFTYLVLLLIISVICYYVIEKPMRNYINASLAKKSSKLQHPPVAKG